MYLSSEEQVFAQIERIRRRAARLLQGEAAPPVPSTSAEEAAHEAEALAGKVELRLPLLVQNFGLSPLGADAVVCLLAAEYDPYLRTLGRALQREVGRPWLELGTIAELLDLPTARVSELARLFVPHGPLCRWALVRIDETTGGETPVVSTKAKLTARVAQHLVGDDTLPHGIALLAPRSVLDESLVPAASAQGVVQRVQRALEESSPLVVEVTGARGTGRRHFAEGLAAELGLPLLVVDLAVDGLPTLEGRLAEARREARLAHALLCLANWDSQLPMGSLPPSEETAAAPIAAPRTLAGPLVRFLEELSGLVVLTAEEREPLLERHVRTIAHVAVPFPSPSQRAGLLAQALEQAGHRPEVDFLAIARRFALDPARIEVAARGALELMLERAGETLTSSDLVEACRHQLHHDLKSLAVRVTASHRWEDLVIPSEVYYALHEMIAYLRHASQVYEEWGFGARHSLAQGVSALFAGPPGTGKTMCASVVARELDMELFRVDLSRVVSKWIGETEKNLGKVFDEAQRSNAIILFDEADSLFAKRTDVKSSVDRYANLEVNFLLQRMESFGGVTILTTNFEDTLDTAFKRRLTFRMRFEKPDADGRSALWRKIFPEQARLAEDFDPVRLGQLFEMSGGNIRNAAVRSAFLAAAEGKAIDMATIFTAAERESREMGLLTQSVYPSVSEPASVSAAEPAAEPERRSPTSGAPRLVPVTHPRK